MEKFRPKSIIVLKRGRKGGLIWELKLGNAKRFVKGLYQAWLKCHYALGDKDRIITIRIEITREK